MWKELKLLGFDGKLKFDNSSKPGGRTEHAVEHDFFCVQNVQIWKIAVFDFCLSAIFIFLAGS
jgi:hypothetical protein